MSRGREHNRTSLLTGIRGSLSENSPRRGFYLLFTVLFCLVTPLVFLPFILSGKSLIWEGDGWSQHFKALVYYGEYLREILKTLVKSHKLLIPEWDLCLGEGGDIVNTLHYYVIGDPIAAFSVFVPTRFMHLFYSVSCVFRIYLAGLALSALCFYTGIKNRCGILAGAFSYMFCSWTVFTVSRHPYFLNPMIWFPLMILGMEKVIRRERPYLFALTVMGSALSNFYFFYVIVLLAVVYAAIRLLFLYKKDIRGTACALLRLAVPAVTGVILAGVILLPILMTFLQDSRRSIQIPWSLFYPLAYYSSLPAMLLTRENLYWLCLGLSAPVILSVCLLYVRRGSAFLRTLLVVCLVMSLLPAMGRIMNGMSYATNRWSWVIALLGAYVLAEEWDSLIRMSAEQWRRTAGCLAVLFVLCLLPETSRTVETAAAVCLLFIAVIVLRGAAGTAHRVQTAQILLALLVVVNAVFMEYWSYSESSPTYLSNRDAAMMLHKNEASLVRRLSDDPYPRYTGRSLTTNANMLEQVSSTQYYWSNSNPYVSAYREEMMTSGSMQQKFEGYDDRTALIALSAVDLYVSGFPAGEFLPYGFTKIQEDNLLYTEQQAALDKLKKELGVQELTEEQEGKIKQALTRTFHVYENQYALPPAYCYDAYIPRERWEALDAVQKQQVQLEAVYLEQEPGPMEEYSGTVGDLSVPYEISASGQEITVTDGRIVTTAPDQKVTIVLEGRENAETYIALEGLDFRETLPIDLYSEDTGVDPRQLYNRTNWDLLSPERKAELRKERLYHTPVGSVSLQFSKEGGAERSITYLTPYDSFTSGKHDYIVNMGYQEEPVSSVTVTFPERGVYTVSSVKVYCVPMDDYPEQVTALKESSPEDLQIGTDTVSGEITRDRPGLLCVAIPYSAGWKACVDDMQTDVLLANGHYLGVPVPEGTHRITLHYDRPYKTAGLLLSAAGLAMLAVLILFTERKIRNQTKRVSESG